MDDPVVIVTWVRGVEPIFVEEFDGGVCTFTHNVAKALPFKNKKAAKGTAFLHGLMGESYAFKRRSEFTPTTQE